MGAFCGSASIGVEAIALSCPLFRQVDLAFDMELPGNYPPTCVLLASPDANRVITLSDDGISTFGYHPQVAIFQLEVKLLAARRVRDECAGIHGERCGAHLFQEETSERLPRSG